jgi:hypothetical protein
VAVIRYGDPGTSECSPSTSPILVAQTRLLDDACIYTDLLEIAAYVYAADCSAQRGREWADGDSTEPWGWDFSFVIGVREPDFWGSKGISSLLTEVLTFLSNDKYSFTLVPLKHDRPEQEYFEFGDPKDWAFHQPDRAQNFVDSTLPKPKLPKNAKKKPRFFTLADVARIIASVLGQQRCLLLASG